MLPTVYFKFHKGNYYCYFFILGSNLSKETSCPDKNILSFASVLSRQLLEYCLQSWVLPSTFFPTHYSPINPKPKISCIHSSITHFPTICGAQCISHDPFAYNPTCFSPLCVRAEHSMYFTALTLFANF